MIDPKARVGSAPQNHYDLVRRIETVRAELPYEIKELSNQVSSFCKKDKKLASLRKKTELKASGKRLDRLDSFEKDYISAYKRCLSYQNIVNKSVDELNYLYEQLADYYSSVGNRKESKKTVALAGKFENSVKKQLDPIVKDLNSATQLFSIDKDSLTESVSKAAPQSSPKQFDAPERQRETARGEQEQNPGTYRQNNAYNRPPQNIAYSYVPYYEYRMPPRPQQPPVINIAPVTVDINRYVESALDSFAKTLEKRIQELIIHYTPEINVTGAPSVSGAEMEATEKIIEDSAFAAEKITALLDNVKKLLSNITELNEMYNSLEEKQRSAIEAGRAVNEMQRALAREIQGMQATQKVITGDQKKLAEEQTLVAEAQKLVNAQQSELIAAQNEISAGAKLSLDLGLKLSEGTDARIEAFNALVAEQEASLQREEKTVELQKALAMRQIELTEMQREALAEQKKLSRSQKALNERVGAPKKAKIQKSAEANDGPTATVAEEIELDELSAKDAFEK